MLSKAFSKSIKAQKVSWLCAFRFLMMVVRVYRWSRRDLRRRKPFCSSAYIPCDFINVVNLLLIIALNILATVDIKLIPLWLNGSKGSLPVFSIGCIIPLYHIDGILPVSKQVRNSLCSVCCRALTFNISFGILSIPVAFPFLHCFNAFIVFCSVVLAFNWSDAR